MIALCVGHSRQGDSGASSVDGTTEWDYNTELAALIVHASRLDIRVYDSYEGRSYASAMRNLSKRLRKDRAELAVELHFNAASPKATGHEWLYWHTSTNGRLLARALRDSMEDAFPDLTSRGIKARKSGTRGSGFLRGTHCPVIICEPFFGTNPDVDWPVASNEKPKIAQAIADGLLLYQELVSKWE